MATELEEKLKDTLRVARDRIRQLQEELAQAGPGAAPVAVVGMACRFPGGADDPEEFRRLLLEGYDGVGEVPADRFDLAPLYDPHRGEAGKTYVRRGGFLRGEPGLFDAKFFRIAPAEALVMDPQQRHLLELSWRALEDAGLLPERLRGSGCGVFLGVSSVDYIAARMYGGSASEIDPWSTTGAMACSAAGRLSYFYDWRGPAVAVDTACSSSLVAIQQAVEALRGKRCDLALAGGVNLMLTSAAFLGLCAMNALAPDGRCKTFSQGADGFGRGEGCGLLVLKRLEDAERDGDRIHAVFLGGAVGHCGVGNGFTAPNGPGQEEILRRALADAGLRPDEVGFIEAHGTGTPLGDPIELGALQTVYGKRSAPLLVGSVKPNIGHLEAAAGIAGVIKAIYSVRDGVLAPTTHTLPASDRIEWERLSMQVVRERKVWPEGAARRVAGVSSFGISGTGAHLLLAQPPVRPERGELAPTRRRVFLLSALSPEAVREGAAQLLAWLGGEERDVPAACAELAVRRTKFAQRLAVSGATNEEICARLRAWLSAAEGDLPAEAEGVSCGKAGGLPGAVFVFGGQGSQVPGMGEALAAEFPVFAQVLQRCEAVWQRLTGGSLRTEMTQPAAASRLGQTRFTQPAIFACQVALAELWRSLGVRPTLLIGHSIGEYAAACVAGVFSVEDGMELVTRRAELVEAHALPGGMAAVFADPAQIPAEALGDPQCVIAACNAPGQTVLAGAAEALAKALEVCRAAGIGCKELRVSHPFHAPMMDPVLPHFERELKRFSYQPPKIPLLSTLTAAVLDASTVWPEYFLQQMRQPVRFCEVARMALEQGQSCFLEIGAFPVLSGLLRRQAAGACRIIPSQRGAEEPLDALEQALGALFCAGVPVDWEAVFGAGDVGSGVPGYPFQRQNYYINPARPVGVVSSAQACGSGVGAATPSTADGSLAAADAMTSGAGCAAWELARMQAAALERLVQMQAGLLQAAADK